jgi:predicted anti-sigma-YlaC factor YlaD
MTCKEVHEHLLEAAQENSVAGLNEHLSSCANCAQELESMRRTMALLDEWQAPEPSQYFDSRLRARLREAAAERRSWLAWARGPAVAFALALLMVVSIALFRNAPNHDATGQNGQTPAVHIGTAVGDLQELEHDGDMYANFDVLDDVGAGPAAAHP